MAERLEGADLDLVAHAHSALAGGSDWTEVMQALNRRFNFTYSMISTVSRGPTRLGAGLTSAKPHAIREVLDYWSQYDTRTPRYIAQALTKRGLWVSDAQLYERREIASSPLHHEYFHPRGAGDFAGLTHRVGDTDYFFIGGVPVDGQLQPAETLERLGATLAPIMQVADLWVIKRRSRLLQEIAMTGAGRPMVLIDQQGRWSWAGDGARKALATVLTLSNGRPVFADRRPWIECLAALSRSDASLPPVAVERAGAPPLVVTALVVDTDPFAPFATGDLYAVLNVHDGAGAPQSPAHVLEALGLTPAEARLAVRVGRAMSPAEAAAELDISLTTARGALASVYGKLGLRRQAELVRLVTLLLN